MTDLRARLAEALINRLADYDINDRDMAESLTNTLLSLPGIAIVELPEPTPTRMPSYQVWFSAIGNVLITEENKIFHRDSFRSVDDLRELAAALLAAANTAQQDTP